MGHLVVVGLVFEEAGDFVHDQVVVGAHQFHGAGVECFGALRGIAHHEHGLAQAGGLFLDAAGVGEDDGRFLHQVHELEVLEGFDEEEVGIDRQVLPENLADGLAHVRVQVHGVDEVHPGILLAQVLHGGDHADEAFAEVLAAMAGNQHQLAAVVEAGDVVAGVPEDIDLFIGEGFVALELVDDHVEGVDDGVARDEDVPMGLLIQEVLLAERGGREVVGGDAPGDLPVHLLRPGAVDVVGAEARFDMAHGDLLVERGERSRRAGGRVAMDQDHIWLHLRKHIAHPREHPRRHIIQVLPLLHDIQVEVRLHLEDPQHLVQHLPMLPRHAHDRLKLLRILLELLHQRAHLDGLRPGPENEHDFFHSFDGLPVWRFYFSFYLCSEMRCSPLRKGKSLHRAFFRKEGCSTFFLGCVALILIQWIPVLLFTPHFYDQIVNQTVL